LNVPKVYVFSKNFFEKSKSENYEYFTNNINVKDAKVTK
jgi:hypothetical protein